MRLFKITACIPSPEKARTQRELQNTYFTKWVPYEQLVRRTATDHEAGRKNSQGGIGYRAPAAELRQLSFCSSLDPAEARPSRAFLCSVLFTTRQTPPACGSMGTYTPTPQAALSLTSPIPRSRPTARTQQRGGSETRLLPLPWPEWPAEARLLLSMVAVWSLLGLLVLTSASWWVAEREMGDAAYYLKRQGIWLLASSGLLLARDPHPHSPLVASRSPGPCCWGACWWPPRW
jgi:hypothetical protein